MFERFTSTARMIVVAAQEKARERGHQQITTLHLLLALFDTDVGEALRAHGVTRGAVERELARLLARDPRDADDDSAVLAALGIDVDRIREAVEASFGPGALDHALDGQDRRPSLFARLTGGRLGGSRAPADEMSALRTRGRGRQPRRHIPFSPAAKKALELGPARGAPPEGQHHRRRPSRPRPAARLGRRGGHGADQPPGGRRGPPIEHREPTPALGLTAAPVEYESPESLDPVGRMH